MKALPETKESAKDPYKRLILRYASLRAPCEVRVKVDGKVIVSRMKLLATGGWDQWKDSAVIRLKGPVKKGTVIIIERIGKD